MKYPIWKPILILAVLVISGAVLWSKGLKPGIDLAGGTTLVYDVKIPAHADPAKTIDDTIAVLRERVDPTGTRNLIWRRVAGNRLEVQMAQAPKSIAKKREAYIAAKHKLQAGNIDPRRLEAAMQVDDKARQTRQLKNIAGGNAKLLHRLQALATQHRHLEKVIEPYSQAQDAFRELQAKLQSLPDAADKQKQSLQEQSKRMEAELVKLARQTNAARADYQQARQQVLSVNVSPDQWQRIADLSDKPPAEHPKAPSPRAAALTKLRKNHPQRVADINALAQAWKQYEAVKGPLDDYTDLIQLLKGSGVLEFRIAASPGQNGRPIDAQSYIQQLHNKGPSSGGSRPWKWYQVDDVDRFFDTPEQRKALADNPQGAFQRRGLVGEKYNDKYYLLLADTPDLAMTREQDWKLQSISRSQDQLMRPAVGFQTDVKGEHLMSALTKPNVNQNMAVMLDNKVVTAPSINDELPGRGIIEGDFSNAQFEYYIRTLKAGSLEGTLQGPISIKQTGPQLGQDNLHAGIEAAVLALIIVAVFMAIYYFFAGGVADFALAANMVIILGAMAMVKATFTLPGIAGMVLTIGMAVDANVLIYERIREEFERGADIATGVRLGYEKAFSTIVDANLTTLITCLVLGYTATADVKGFAVTLGIGIVATLFTSLFCTRVIMEFYANTLKAKTLPMLPTVCEPIRKLFSPNIDWVNKRRIFLPISLLLIVLGLIAVFERGVGLLDIQFRSGTQVSFNLKGDQTLPISQAKSRLKEVAALGEDIQQGQPAPQGKQDEYQLVGAVIQQARNKARKQAPHEADQQPATDREDAAGAKANPQPAAANLASAGGALAARPQVIRFDHFADASVVTTGQTQGAQAHGFTVSTLITDSQTVSELVKVAFHDVLDTSQPLEFDGADKQKVAGAPVYPITDAQLGRDVNRVAVDADVSDYLGGSAIVLDHITPAATVKDLQQRINRMRLQQEYESLGYRRCRVVPFAYAGANAKGDQLVRGAVVVSTDQQTNYIDSPNEFDNPQGLAATEWQLVRDAMQQDTALASVSNFSSQVSATMQQQAIAAMALSLLAVMAYIWLRFGSIRYGFAAIIALGHDVCITMGFVAVCGWIYDSAFGHALMLSSFKVNLALVAAILTIIGYSINDTVVVFDRIRENRGRLSRATPGIINDSINQTISRTVLTSGTTLLAIIVLYLVGGAGIHGFAYAMLIGVVVGTYSSIAIASPILLIGKGMGKDQSKDTGGEKESKIPVRADTQKPTPAQPVTTG